MKSSSQLMVKECTLGIGKLPLGGLPRKSVVRITDSADITSSVYHGRNALNQKKKSNKVSIERINTEYWLTA